MPITASINRHPETENESQNAPHPEEMKATFDLAIGNAARLMTRRDRLILHRNANKTVRPPCRPEAGRCLPPKASKVG